MQLVLLIPYYGEIMLIATRSKIIVYQGNTQVLVVNGLEDDITGDFLNNFTVNGTIINDQGNPVAIGIVFTYVAGSNGNYQAIWGDNNFYPPVGTGYTLLLDGTDNSSFIHVELIVEVQPRQM